MVTYFATSISLAFVLISARLEPGWRLSKMLLLQFFWAGVNCRFNGNNTLWLDCLVAQVILRPHQTAADSWRVFFSSSQLALSTCSCFTHHIGVCIGVHCSLSNWHEPFTLTLNSSTSIFWSSYKSWNKCLDTNKIPLRCLLPKFHLLVLILPTNTLLANKILWSPFFMEQQRTSN